MLQRHNLYTHYKEWTSDILIPAYCVHFTYATELSEPRECHKAVDYYLNYAVHRRTYNGALTQYNWIYMDIHIGIYRQS